MNWIPYVVGGLALVVGVGACMHPTQAEDTVNQSPTVSVKVFDSHGKLVGPITMPRVVKTDAQWRKELSPEAYQVTRQEGTERPGTCAFLHSHEPGVYICIACGLPLFQAGNKFESGTGWPSFFEPLAKENVVEVNDESYGMIRTEIRCARCGAHLGHVFNDGPPPTGLRYCMNGVALKFTPEKDLATLADPASEKTPAASQPVR